MILTGLARLGRDAELRFTQGGDPVATLALAFNYGTKDASGNKPTQWVEAALWGKRAEALAQHLTKGTAVDVVLTDPHVETFEKKDKSTGFKFVGKVSEIEFAGGGNQQSSGSSASKPAQKPAPSSQSGGYGDPGDDLPF
jgi:single-strand DNA-binding protein